LKKENNFSNSFESSSSDENVNKKRNNNEIKNMMQCKINILELQKDWKEND